MQVAAVCPLQEIAGRGTVVELGPFISWLPSGGHEIDS